MRISLVVALGLGLTACADEEGLRVSGSAALEVGGSQSGFFFTETTLLVPGVPQEGDRRIGGTCLLPSDGGVASVTLVRTGAEGEGIAISEVAIDVSANEAAVEITTADATYIGAPDPVSCSITEKYRDLAEGLLGIDADCQVQNQDGDTARFVADLHFADCGKI
jgi:hypothetical protein